MSKKRIVFWILFGVVLIAVAVAMFAHDADYILTGNTVNLNEILENGGELPRDKFVTYTCNISLGNYAETREYIDGIIPLPGKTQQFAMLTENGMIISAEIETKTKIDEMMNLTENIDYDNPTTPVVITGCFEINSSDMDRCLINYFSGYDLEDSGIILTSYVINTTKTRAGLVALYLFVFVVGVCVLEWSVKKMIRKYKD